MRGDRPQSRSPDKLITIARCARAHANRHKVKVTWRHSTTINTAAARASNTSIVCPMRARETRRTCQMSRNNTRIDNRSLFKELRAKRKLYTNTIINGYVVEQVNACLHFK